MFYANIPHALEPIWESGYFYLSKHMLNEAQQVSSNFLFLSYKQSLIYLAKSLFFLQFTFFSETEVSIKFPVNYMSQCGSATKLDFLFLKNDK
jgi:hypothetical protein